MKKYIATRFAFLSYGLLVGLLSVGDKTFLFPIFATIIGYIMTTKYIMKQFSKHEVKEMEVKNGKN